MKLQERLVEHLKSPGDVAWGSWRGFRNEERETEEPFRVVDGELVERFLDLDEGLQGTIVQGLPGAVGVADMRGLVEGLRMLH
jgi:DNA damage-binding protein 1